MDSGLSAGTTAPPIGRLPTGWIVPLAAVAAYAAALANGFTYDDRLVIEEAEHFLGSPSLSGLLSADYFALSREMTYRPVVTLTYVVDHAIGGLRPWVYHAHSVLWHAATASLLLALVRRLMPAAPARVGVMVAAFFAVHPLTTEAVDNASFREDVLATFFVLAAILLALRPAPLRMAAALSSYALALFSKESAIVAPVLLAGCFVVARCEPRNERRQRAVTLALFGAVTLAYLGVRFGPMSGAPEYASHPGGSLAGALQAMPAVFAHYLRLLVVPWPLCADYSGVFDFTRRPVSPSDLWPLAVVAAFVAAAVAVARRDPVAALGIAWFVVALAPVSNVIPIPVPVADRFLYLPLAGAALALAAGMHHAVTWAAPRSPWLVTAPGVVALVILGVLTIARHPAWRDNHSLWTITARDHPRSWGARHGLGTALRERGDLAGAEQQLEAALRMGPPPSARALIDNDLGVVYGLEGRLDDSEAVLLRAVSDGGRSKAYLNLGITRLRKGDRDGGRLAILEAARRDPYHARPLAFLASIARQDGDVRAARELISRARQLDPRDPWVGAEAAALQHEVSSPTPATTVLR